MVPFYAQIGFKDLGFEGDRNNTYYNLILTIDERGIDATSRILDSSYPIRGSLLVVARLSSYLFYTFHSIVINGDGHPSQDSLVTCSRRARMSMLLTTLLYRLQPPSLIDDVTSLSIDSSSSVYTPTTSTSAYTPT